MDLGLHDRVAVVTGGSSGIGLATVKMLLAEGAYVVTCARNADRLNQATALLPEQRLLAMRCDVLDRDACEAFIAAAIERFGRLDVLVNNAGKGHLGRLAELTSDDWRSEVDAKLFGVLNPLRAALPHLRRSDAARVINISAVTGREPDPELLAVGAARAAVSNLSRGLADELAPDGILINTVSVGVIATARALDRYQKSARSDPQQTFEQWAEEEAIRRGITLGRLGQPDEVAAAIVFLASAAASYITGASLDVAGGLNRAW